MPRDAVIEVENLSYRYGEQSVLDTVSFRVERGEFLGIIGPNGGGKTTVLRILLGLLKPTSGHVRIFGENPTDGMAWRQRVGVVPQQRDINYRFPIRARDVVELGLQARGGKRFSRRERTTLVDEALSLVGAQNLEERPLWKLSGGQRQRIFVARALVSNPEILLLDEPTVGVDVEGEDLLLKWIARWKDERDLTVVLVTHDVGVIAPLADNLACLNVKLHFHDKPERLTGEVIEQAYGCPAEVIFHSGDAVPHVVLREHRHK
jgi:zinc transport system ATP-binding protein